MPVTPRMNPALAVASLALAMLLAGPGCGDDGTTGGSLCANVNCPAGFTCVESGGKAQCVAEDAGVDAGTKKDITPNKDGPAPNKDTGQPADQKVLDKGPPIADLPPTSVVKVTLLSPTDKSSIAAADLQLKFKATSPNPVAKCELWMDGKLRDTMSKPGAAPYFSLQGSSLKDGKHTWSVKCLDVQSQVGGSPVWTFSTAPLSLTGCKTGGFKTNTRYRLAKNIQGGTGDCFIIDAPEVSFDGNGKTITAGRFKDLVMHRSTSMAATVFRNPGTSTGAWTKTWTSPNKDNVGDTFTAADFNGDGMLDLVLPDLNGTLRVFRNLGAGNYSSVPYYNSKNKKMTSPRTLDLNQDDRVDLVLAGLGAKEALVLNSGLAGLVHKTSYDWGNLTLNLDPIDMNGDAIIDMVAGSFGSGWQAGPRVGARGNLAGTNFSFSSVWSSNDARGGGPAYMADFNSDKDWDLLLPYTWLNSHSSRVFTGTGSGSFKVAATYANTIPVAARDMNGDGHTDLVLMYGANPSYLTHMRVYYGTGTGKFNSNATTLTAPSGGFKSWIVRDLDGDERPDLAAITGSTSRTLVVYQNQPKTTGGFKTTYTYTSSSTSRILDARDLNNDGLLDLVSSASGGNTVMLHTQKPGLGFSGKTILYASPSIHTTVAASPGDLTTPPARAVYIKKGSSGVKVSSIPAIRGFATGILVEGDKAHISGIVVEDSDQYGVRFADVTTGKVEQLSTRYFFQGVGLSLHNATIVTVNDCDLCDGGHDRRLTAVGARCVKSAVNGANNRLRLNNGCTTLAYKPCP